MTDRTLAEVIGTLSPSKLEVATQCGAKFLFDYVENMPRRFRADGQLGNAVDDTGNQVYRGKAAALEGAAVLTPDDLAAATPSAKVVADVFAAAWDFEAGAVDDWQGDTRASILGEGVRMVRGWRERIAAYVFPRTTQRYMRKTLKDPKTGERFDLAGIVDLIGSTAVPSAVVDLKQTGKRYNDSKLTRSFQPVAYTLLAEVPVFEFHVLVRTAKPSPPQILRATISDADRDAFVARAAMVRRQIAHSFRTGDWFPNRGHMLCSRRYCDRWQVCEQRFGGTVPQ